MDLIMRCNKCNREVHFAEFMGYATGYLLEKIGPMLLEATVKALIACLTATAEKSSPNAPTEITLQTRGVVDNTMAGIALYFKIACPDCKQCCWQAASTPNVEIQKKAIPKSPQKKEVSTST